MHASIDQPGLCWSFHLKMTGTSCTDDARVKVPSFQNVTFFYNMKYSTETPSICIFVCLKMHLTAVIRNKHASNDLLQSSFHEDKHYQQLDHRKQVLCIPF